MNDAITMEQVHSRMATEGPIAAGMDAHRHSPRHQQLIATAAHIGPIVTAVVHPVDENALLGAIEASRNGLITPILIGPETRIRAAAAAADLDLSPFPIVPVKHSHAAAEQAAALARAGKAQAIMKGSLQTAELMAALVATDAGLRTSRRMSHVFVVDSPGYPRWLLITDAALNIVPTLEDKRDIVQNAIDLAQTLDISCPHVAILAAVELVSSKMRSTIDAAALCKMAERGQIIGGVVDGPLAYDTAISPEAAQIKGLHSTVAGQADILVVPDLESGNMLVKQLKYLAGAEPAGIVLGARVPIVLTSRADSVLAHRAACALAVLIAQHDTNSRAR